MSSGNDLQEMEVGTTQSKTAVNAGAVLADPMVKPSGAASKTSAVLLQKIASSDDDSNKVKEPGATLKQVKDVVNAKAKPAEPMAAAMKEEEVETEVEADQEVVAEASKRKLPLKLKRLYPKKRLPKRKSFLKKKLLKTKLL